jgi:hypothetical protein
MLNRMRRLPGGSNCLQRISAERLTSKQPCGTSHWQIDPLTNSPHSALSISHWRNRSLKGG